MPLPLTCAHHAQSFLNYALLTLVYGGLRLYRTRRAGGALRDALVPPAPLRSLALLAALDVEANFLIVKAYQFTNITSVTLLDSARRARRGLLLRCLAREALTCICPSLSRQRSIPAAMLFSRAVLRVRYGRTHLAGAALVLAGFAVLVASDAACSRRGSGGSNDSGSPLRAPAPLLGDALAVGAACLYAASNVATEKLLRDDVAVPDLLAWMGALGAGIAGVQTALLESRALAAAPWAAHGGALPASLAAFALAMLAIYSLAPRALAGAGAAAFNLHMLSSDLWAAAARAAAFGGFAGGCAGGGFAAALLAVAAGLGVYLSAGPPAGGAAVAPHGDDAAPAEEGAALLAAEQADGGGDDAPLLPAAPRHGLEVDAR